MTARPRGRFITFEGIDGTGKSSSLARVAAALRQRFPDLVATREETDGPAGQAVKESIARHADPLATALLFVADRAAHAPELRAHLEAGRHVLCDRYALSTYAYQSVTLRGRLADPVGFLRRLHEPIGLEPDHTLLFVADPERCVARTQRRGATTPYEKVAFLRDVQEAYVAISADVGHVRRLDAERPMGEVADDAVRIVSEWLG